MDRLTTGDISYHDRWTDYLQEIILKALSYHNRRTVYQLEMNLYSFTLMTDGNTNNQYVLSFNVTLNETQKQTICMTDGQINHLG